jgi:predicted nucleotidyltransferase
MAATKAGDIGTDSRERQLPHHHQVVTDRFVAACQADARVVAALLVGSYARGAADAYSDLDLYLLAEDDAYDDLLAGREAFVRRLGEPVFLEDFGSAVSLYSILSDGIEGELEFGRESELSHVFSGACRVLLDKKRITAGMPIPWHEAAQPQLKQMETLRRQVCWFWHDLSHFMTAIGRGQLWWASGQLEALRLYCVNLARLRQNFSDPEVGAEGYFKVEQALPVEQLSPLQATFCPQKPGAMLRAALLIVRFYRELAPDLARMHGMIYPDRLDRMMSARLDDLCEARLK